MAHWVKNDISKAYASFRPTYPKELFDYIDKSPLLKQKDVAIDVGCGTGQATVPLAQLYKHVVGVDPSSTQIANADPKGHKNIDFLVANADNFDSLIPASVQNKVNFISVFQAVHWFNIPTFAAACHRAAEPKEGTVGLITYKTVQFPDNKQLTDSVAQMDAFLHEKGYWPAERWHIDEEYATINAKMAENGWNLMASERFDNRAEVTYGHLIAYLKTWSALDRYDTKHKAEGGIDVVVNKYIMSVLQAQFTNEPAEQILNRQVTMTFPVLAFFFKRGKVAGGSKL